MAREDSSSGRSGARMILEMKFKKNRKASNRIGAAAAMDSELQQRLDTGSASTLYQLDVFGSSVTAAASLAGAGAGSAGTAGEISGVGASA